MPLVALKRALPLPAFLYAQPLIVAPIIFMQMHFKAAIPQFFDLISPCFNVII